MGGPNYAIDILIRKMTSFNENNKFCHQVNILYPANIYQNTNIMGVLAWACAGMLNFPSFHHTERNKA